MLPTSLARAARALRSGCLTLACGALVGIALAAPAGAVALLYGHFRHSSADTWINVAESYQSAATGPLADAVPPLGGPLFGRYEVDYGEIRLYASNDGTSPPPATINFTNAGTTAGFQDSFVLTAPGIANGSPGTMRVRIDVTGTLLASGTASAGYVVNLWIGQSCCAQLFGTRYGGGGGIVGSAFGSYELDVPILFGLQDRIEIQANVDASGSSNPGSAIADLSSTVGWGGVLAVYDAQGNPVPVFSLASESSYDYATLRPAVVPEAAALWMLASATLALGVLRRRC